MPVKTVVYLLMTSSTLMMCGLIWFVQIVHYYLFNKVGEKNFVVYERLHQQRTSMVVVPLMLIELASNFALIVLRPEYLSQPMAWTLLVLVLTIWLATFLIQVPQHAQLAKGFTHDVYQKIVRYNWLRTVLWSIKSILCLYVLMIAL